MQGKLIILSMTITLLLCSVPAVAYVGPGAGLSLLAALWGLLVAVGVALVYVLIWPIRRWRHRRNAAAADDGSEVASEHLEIPATVDSPRDDAGRR